MEEFLKNVKELSKNEKDYSQSLRDESAEFLADFCLCKKPKKVLEIGTNVGFSSLIILKNSEATLTTLEKDEHVYMQAKANFAKAKVKSRVKQILGDAKQVLATLPKNYYDLIFLDGPKGQYIKYLPLMISLLKKGGYLIADNVYFQGKVLQEGHIPHKHRTIVVNLRKFLTQIQDTNIFETSLLDIDDGISVSKKVCF